MGDDVRLPNFLHRQSVQHSNQGNMFGFSLLILLLSNIIIHSSAFSPRISALYRRSSNVVVAAANTEVEDMRGSREGGSDRDLTDYKLWITFTGFEVKDMHFGIGRNMVTPIYPFCLLSPR